MGSNWRNRHFTIMPYSIGGFHGLARTFFMGSLLLFHGLAFCFDGRAREFTCLWKTTGLHRSKQKKQIDPIGLLHLFTAFFNPGEPPLYPTRSHLLWLQGNYLSKKKYQSHATSWNRAFCLSLGILNSLFSLR